MSGRANKCDISLLQSGSPCIIVVDKANSPTGIWWGEVVEVEGRDSYLRVQAKITDGPFHLDDHRRAVRTKDDPHTMPGPNYTVYPDNETTRSLFHQLQMARQETEAASRNASQWRQCHLDTMAHLAQLGLVEKNKK